MLHRSARLTTQQFNSVMEKGRAYHSTLFLLRVVKVSEPSTITAAVTSDVARFSAPTALPSRIAASVPNKVAKKAVERTRMRRVMYEAIRPLYVSVDGGHHVVVFAKSAAISADNDVLKKDMREIFVKAGLLR